MTTETCMVSRARLDALACQYMKSLEDCGFKPMSLNEFMAEYSDHEYMTNEMRDLGVAILGLFPEYGGENDPV